MKPGENLSDLKKAFLANKPVFQKALFFSFFINMMIMAPTLYMLEVYDRVVNSRNVWTLVMLTVAVVMVYVMMEMLQWVRSRMLHGAAVRFDSLVNQRLFDTMFEASLRKVQGGGIQAMADLRVIRDFLPSQGFTAMMDVPMAMIYILVIFVINPILGWMSVVGALIQVGLAILTERNTQQPLSEASRAAIGAQNYINGSLRNAQVIEAMGMQKGIHKRWLGMQNEFLGKQAQASDKAGAYSSVSKFVQLTQSSLLLGGGCFLTIEGLFPGGGGLMIVASTLGGKVLTPIVQLIGAWKSVVAAREAFNRLEKLFDGVPVQKPGMPLPPPQGALSVEGVYASAPGSSMGILRGVTFATPPGNIVALIGPSASGKSTLARLLVGVWQPTSGKVRLDGVDIFPWNKSELGPHIGYLPQDVELFDGSLAENIARFGDVDMGKVQAAAMAVGIHDLAMSLDGGYDSQIGDEGCFLSGGQRQRIGLARAIYGNPRFVVLDEPNSSLDEAGEAALVLTLQELKGKGATVIIITHRTNVLSVADQMLLLSDGQVKAFGPRDEVLAALQRSALQAKPQAPALQTVAA